jgi:hypothetical protein
LAIFDAKAVDIKLKRKVAQKIGQRVKKRNYLGYWFLFKPFQRCANRSPLRDISGLDVEHIELLGLSCSQEKPVSCDNCDAVSQRVSESDRRSQMNSVETSQWTAEALA